MSAHSCASLMPPVTDKMERIREVLRSTICLHVAEACDSEVLRSTIRLHVAEVRN